jgi:hypothetical protein
VQEQIFYYEEIDAPFPHPIKGSIQFLEKRVVKDEKAPVKKLWLLVIIKELFGLQSPFKLILRMVLTACFFAIRSL